MIFGTRPVSSQLAGSQGKIASEEVQLARRRVAIRRGKGSRNPSNRGFRRGGAADMECSSTVCWLRDDFWKRPQYSRTQLSIRRRNCSAWFPNLSHRFFKLRHSLLVIPCPVLHPGPEPPNAHGEYQHHDQQRPQAERIRASLKFLVADVHSIASVRRVALALQVLS